MEREEKVEKVRIRNKKRGQQQELFVVNLKRGILVGKRGGNSTPSPTWRIGLAQADGSLVQDLPFSCNSTSLSVRKLGANLLEFQPKVTKMSKIGTFTPNHRDKSFKVQTQQAEPHEQATSTSSLGRDIAASLRQHHHHLLAKNGDAQSLKSPESYCSSMEMTPYQPAVTPTSSNDLKGGIGRSRYNLKTSTELIKILNKIWCLEEQHASNMSVVKALKRELDHSQRHVRELQEEKKRDREELDNLMTVIGKFKINRKKNKPNRTDDTVKAMADELQDERKLRKHAEDLHLKTSRELAEVKSYLSNAFKDLERERKARIMLEELCDEFAYGIKEYETEVRFLRSKLKKDQRVTEEKDGLIIHISEAWLDERMQMKQAQSRHDFAEKKMVVDKLRSEIRTFLKARQSSDNRKNVLKLKGAKGSSVLGHSLESFHLNKAASATTIENEDGVSFDNVLHASKSNKDLSGKHDPDSCINQHKELAPNIPVEKITESNSTQEKIETQVSKDPSAASSRMQPGEKILEDISSKGNKAQFRNEEEAKVVKEAPAEGTGSCALENSDMKQRYTPKINNNRIIPQTFMLNLPSEAMSVQDDGKHVEHSFDPTTFTGPASPVQKWTSKLTAPDNDAIESFSKLPLGVKENTLKAKLIEARLESQQVKPRATKGVS